jgi:predicted metal-dependent enzyme (double-stranded beta helix superfamily)
VRRFDIDELIADCVAAQREAQPVLATRDILARVVADPDGVAEALPPLEGGIGLLHHTTELTIMNIVWAPDMTLLPHDHRMWAAIAIYAGREDNTFFRRDADRRGHIVETSGKEFAPGDVALLGDDAIHMVHNPLARFTGAIHVYGGDFVNEPRSQWGPGARVEQPFDMDFVLQEFADANARAGADGPSGA